MFASVTLSKVVAPHQNFSMNPRSNPRSNSRLNPRSNPMSNPRFSQAVTIFIEIPIVFGPPTNLLGRTWWIWGAEPPSSNICPRRGVWGAEPPVKFTIFDRVLVSMSFLRILCEVTPVNAKVRSYDETTARSRSGLVLFGHGAAPAQAPALAPGPPPCSAGVGAGAAPAARSPTPAQRLRWRRRRRWCRRLPGLVFCPRCVRFQGSSARRHEVEFKDEFLKCMREIKRIASAQEC